MDLGSGDRGHDGPKIDPKRHRNNDAKRKSTKIAKNCSRTALEPSREEISSMPIVSGGGVAWGHSFEFVLDITYVHP